LTSADEQTHLKIRLPGVNSTSLCYLG